MRYDVRIHPRAVRELAALPKRFQRQIDRRIVALADDPRPPQARKLAGPKRQTLWRIRSGDYRIVYAIRRKRLVVLIVRIAHRGDVYRDIPWDRADNSDA